MFKPRYPYTWDNKPNKDFSLGSGTTVCDACGKESEVISYGWNGNWNVFAKQLPQGWYTLYTKDGGYGSSDGWDCAHYCACGVECATQLSALITRAREYEYDPKDEEYLLNPVEPSRTLEEWQTWRKRIFRNTPATPEDE